MSEHELPPGEEGKRLAVAGRLWDELAVDRAGTVVALGGGCVTDVAGFVAATHLRGVPWVAVPTTLVGQVDAAIGGKTGLDTGTGKNRVGAFHWPARTVIDPAFLETLPAAERRAGMAEVVKTGLLAGEPLWELPDAELVRRAAAFKTAVCLRDPTEQGERAILNLGHTFGHALEAASGYAVRHGDAVALGLTAALELSERRYGLDAGWRVRVRELLDPQPVAVDRDAARARARPRQEGRRRPAAARPARGARPAGRDRRGAARRGACGARLADLGDNPAPVRIDVLNGVNLNVLSRRDPEMYGGLSLQELESQIYKWASELGCQVRCRQTNSEGLFVAWCHDARRGHRRHHRQPGRLDALQLGDPRRARARRQARRRGAPVERGRARGVAAVLGARGSARPPRHRQGARGLPRGARLSGGARVNPRVDRLRELLEQPLLVTNLTNVRYLTGFRSSNAALIVEPERVRLFADFRYAEAGRQVPGVEFEITKRALAVDIATRAQGALGFEAGSLPYAHYEVLATGGLELVPTHGLVEGLRAVKDEGEIAALRAVTEITNAAFERFSREPVIGQTERDLAFRMDTFFHELGADGLAFPTIAAAGPERRQPAHDAGRPGGRGGADADRGRGRDARRLLLGLHAHVRGGRARGRAARGLLRLPARAAGRARRGAPGGHRLRRRCRRAQHDRGGRLRRVLRSRPRPRRRHGRPRAAAPLHGVRPRRWRRATSRASSRASTCRAPAASASRTSSSSATAGRRS